MQLLTGPGGGGGGSVAWGPRKGRYLLLDPSCALPVLVASSMGPGVLKAGVQGSGHHELPLTAAHRHGLATSQECFIYLCQKPGCSVQPLLAPLEVGSTWKADWPWPPPCPWLGRRRHTRTHPPTCSYTHTFNTPNTHTSSHCAHALAHGHTFPCTGSFTHVHTPSFTHSHTGSNTHLTPRAHACLYLPMNIYVHPHTMTHFVCSHVGHEREAVSCCLV